MVVLEIVFWACVAALVHTHLTYPLSLWAHVRVRGGREPARGLGEDDLPSVSLVVAAHNEEPVIEAKVRNALELDYPRELLEVIVASDGSTDRTAQLARAAGADTVLELPRSGKIAVQDAAATERARGEVLAFSDANALWRPEALRRLVAPFADPEVGYVCGQVRFRDADGHGVDNQEGLYWHYELWVRGLESRIAGVTAGNGAIYAVRRDAYVPLPPSRSHDLSFPVELTKRGWLALYAPRAIAEERLVPTLEGEFRRKRRMMRGLWDIVVRDRMLAPRSYSPIYVYEVVSHRLLRYLSPLLHAGALGANAALLGQGAVYRVAFGAQLAVLAAAAMGRAVPLRPLRIARYYVLVTASIAAGLWDRARLGPPAAWEQAEGTR
jgi:cellulose synthase/poly-beta-1,6-N-acetylglucosamine synthase-like glycosyltransferase